jgi:hypothetical protein
LLPSEVEQKALVTVLGASDYWPPKKLKRKLKGKKREMPILLAAPFCVSGVGSEILKRFQSLGTYKPASSITTFYCGDSSVM